MMDENTLHQWFIECFGPVQGEMAWKQVESLPDQIREQLMSQSLEDLPDPAQIRGMMQAFAGGGLNSFGEMQQTIAEGPINVMILLMPSAYVVETPGPTQDVLGERGGKKVIDVSGVPTHKDSGRLLLVTVNAAGVPGYPVSNAEALWGWAELLSFLRCRLIHVRQYSNTSEHARYADRGDRWPAIGAAEPFAGVGRAGGDVFPAVIRPSSGTAARQRGLRHLQERPGVGRL